MLKLLPGIFLSGVITLVALFFSSYEAITRYGFSGLTIAIIIGMIVGNTLYTKIQPHCAAGIDFSKAKLLRLGIILYGFRLTLQQVADVGMASIVSDILVIGITFSLAYYIGHRWLKLDKETTLLIGSGAAICGAAAIMATEPIVKAKSEKVSVAIATVVVFGTIGIFLYPKMYFLDWWGLSPEFYGIYIGSTVHEVAQVVAAGESISPEVANIAVTTKMIRVMMLAPFLLLLSLLVARGQRQANQSQTRLNIPWFAFIFIGVVVFNSFTLLPAVVVEGLIALDTILLAMAMAALGVTTHFSAIKKAGLKPLILASILMLWLVIGGGLLQQLMA